jgi:hypothetical protein
MVEKTARGPSAVVNAPMVHGDFKPVNVGGVVIEDRGHLRRYLKANDLAPYDPSVAKAARDRIERAQRAERKQGVINAYERTRDAERARKRFG